MVKSKIDQIAPAGMLAKEHHCDSHREWLLKFSAQMHKAGSLEVAWKGEVDGEAVKAYIDYSRWVAACPNCGTVEAVDPEEKLFFCLYCSCEDNSHKARPVEFPEPDVMKRIVRLLLERPVQYMPGPTLYNRIGKAQPAIMLDKHLNEPGVHVQFKLSRSWHYDQTVEELEEEQREALESWRKAVGGQRSDFSDQTSAVGDQRGVE
jgi:hypothetical protein